MKNIKQDEQLDNQHWDVLEPNQAVVLQLLDTIKGELVDVDDDEAGHIVKVLSYTVDTPWIACQVEQEGNALPKC